MNIDDSLSARRPASTSSRPRIAFASQVGVFWRNSGAWSTPASQKVARGIEELGYGSLFFPEGDGKESFVHATTYLTATERLVVGTGIANIYLRHAVSSEGAARTLGAAYPGRFVLGLGVSHGPVLEQFGIKSGKPLADMREYLTQMNSVSEDVEPQAERPARLIGAMGPKMTALSGELGDGANPWFVTPSVTREAREILGPDKWIVLAQPVVVDGDADDQVRRACEVVRFYGALPNYRSSWLRQGFTEEELADTERLARHFVGIGTEHAVERVKDQLEAGADHVLVSVLVDGPGDDPLPQLRILAQALDLQPAD